MEFLAVLAVFVFIVVLAMAILSIRYSHSQERAVLSSQDEAQYELEQPLLITNENVNGILEWQIMKAQGQVSHDHPAIAARKASL